MEDRKITVVAKTLPPKLGGQPPPPTGATRARAGSSPSLPAAKPAAQPPPDPKIQKKKLKEMDWSQKGYFDADGLHGSEKVSTPAEQAPRRGRTLVIPAVQEQPQPQPQPQGEAQGKSAWAEAERPSTHDTRDAQKAREQDAKAAAQQRALGSNPMGRVTQKLAMQPPPLPGADKPKGTLYEMLENAKEPGVLFKEDDEERGSRGEGEGEEEEDPELMEAVEECIQRLFGVRGIHHIGPGKNDKGEPVIVISASTGFGEDSMRRVPDQVRGFKTLVALPFEVLPLKRVTR